MALRHDDTPRAAGIFREKEFGVLFEYATLCPAHAFFEHDKCIGATHLVYVGPWCKPQPGVDRGTRAAIVKRTVAYVAIDEDDMGRPVWEKWSLKNHVEYAR